MKGLKRIRNAALTLATLLLLGVTGLLAHRVNSMRLDYQTLIALSWGDSRYGPALLRAEVHAIPLPGAQQQVSARIYIDRPGVWFSHEHGPIALGHAQNHQNAVAQWGTIQWGPEGVRFGSGDQSVLVPQSVLEQHR